MKNILLPITLLCTTTLFAQNQYFVDSVAAPIEGVAEEMDTTPASNSDYPDAGYDDFVFDPSNLEDFVFNGISYKVYPYVLQKPFEPIIEEEVAAPAPIVYSKKELKKMKKEARDYDEEQAIAIADSAAYASADYFANENNQNWNGEIPPLVYEIPDNTYVLLQAQNDGTRKVRAVFSIQNTLLNGDAVFYNEDGKVSKNGIYREGLKEGVWNDYQYDSTQTYTGSKIYTNGVLNGAYKVYTSRSEFIYVDEEGMYVDGEKTFSKQYNLRADKSVYLQNEMSYSNGIEKIKKYYEDGKLLYESESAYRGSYRRYEMSEISHAALYENLFEAEMYSFSVPYSGEAKYYYRNGNLCAKFTNGGEEEGSSINFDTIFAPDKSVLILRRAMSDSTGFPRYEVIAFNKGKVISIERFIADNNYPLSYEQLAVNAAGVLEVTEADYQLFYSKSDKIADQLYLIRINNNDRKGIITNDYRMPLFEHTAFIKVKSLKDDFSIDFNITDKREQSFAFQNIITFGNAKVVMFSHRDTSKEKSNWKDFSLTGVIQKTLKTGRDFSRDSVKFYYNNKLYSGKIHLFFGNGKRLLHFKKGMLAVDLLALDFMKKEMHFDPQGELSEKQKNILKSFADFTFNNGDITHIYVDFQERREHVVAEASLEKSTLHGKAYGEGIKTNYNGEIYKKERFEADFYYGLPHGVMKEMRWDKQSDKWTIKKLNHYCYGMLCDTSYRYIDGQVRGIEVYNKHGQLNGESKTFTYQGNVQSLKTYENGSLNGVSFEFDDKLDTISYANYINGKRDGAFFESSSMYSNNQYTLRGTYHEGRLIGNLELKDANGIVRMKANVLNKRNAYETDDVNAEYLLKSPFSNLKVEAEYQFFYDNGVKYCDAKTIIDEAYVRPVYDEGAYSEMAMDTARAYNDYSYAAPAKPAYYDGFNGDVKISLDGISKNGLWKYYFPDGKLRYEINYIDSAKVKVGKELVYGCGMYKEYYNNGKLMAKGLLLEEYDEQECETDLFEYTYRVLYTDFLDQNGKVLMTNSTGTAKQYFSNQLVREEGKFINGKKDGWWKEYNREGKLVFVGKYVNGLPDGRWLRGDLEGINYLDDRCFENMQKEQEAIQESQYSLQISETFYKNGIEVKSNYYNFQRAGGEIEVDDLQMKR